jgi:hypothetical protein
VGKKYIKDMAVEDTFQFLSHEIPSNAYEINRIDPSSWNNQFRLNYYTPQEPKDGLFCSRNCSDDWQMQNRNILESLMKSNTFKNPWKGA